MLTTRRVWLAPLILALCGTGCTYLRNRGNDALDMWDVGLSLSSRPYLAFLPADYMNVTPIGFSRIEGTYHGIYKRQWVDCKLSDSIWGVFVCGTQTLTMGEFDPNDPNQFRPAYIAELKAANKPLPTKPQTYGIGCLRVAREKNPPPYPDWFS